LTLFTSLTLGSSASAQNALQLSGNINKIYVTDVTDVSFLVTWTSDEPNNNSSVNFGTTPSSLTSNALDSITDSSTTHSVYVSHGSPTTNIYFEVVSGGEIDDNGGAKYMVTSGAALGVPPSGSDIKGTVYQSGGGPAANVIVYIQLQDADGLVTLGNSQWGSAVTASNGTWIYNLGGLRTENAGAYFTTTFGADKVRINWQGGSAGNIGESPGDERIYTTPSTFPGTFDMTLDSNPTAVTMVNWRAYNAKFSTALIILGIGLLGLSVLGVLWLRKSRASKLA
jgi:hypothetical protein